MSWIATVTGLLPWLRDLLGNVLTGKDRRAEMEHEQKLEQIKLEREQIKQLKGRPTPKMLLCYVAVAILILCLLWKLLSACWPWLPPFPLEWRDVLSLIGISFGFGG